MVKRLYLIVLDGFGIGALPDAAAFGDSDVHTLQSIMKSPAFSVPHLEWLGLMNIEGVDAGRKAPVPVASFARCAERSKGKDTTTGHWEIAGLVSDTPMPTFPGGFPPDLIGKLEKAFGRKIICNQPYSGTEVLVDYGREHEETGALIVYTSVDSVLQIACHERVASEDTLYAFCRKARAICTGPYAVGRVIARPFTGDYPDYRRTAGRHDFSLLPFGETLLDAVSGAAMTTIGVGKISDIFAGRGVSRHIAMDGNEDGMRKTIATQDEDFRGLCFVNLVDFDMQYGHRRDVDGYAGAMARFDQRLGDFIFRMGPEDVLMITADHGCDPAAPGSDHTREYTPLLVYGQTVRGGVNLGTRSTFADIGATAAEILGVSLKTPGTSFWEAIKK